MADTSRELLSQLTQGSEDAAEQIFARYVHRLTALARLRLSERIARRVDPEDIVLSAYRSFFVAVRDGRFELNQGGDLWRLLVAITMNKLRNQVAAHQSLKRSTRAEAGDHDFDTVPSRDPTPEEVLTASEELEAILAELPAPARRVLELRLQGESLEAIASEVSRKERTVRRMLDEAREVFRRRLDSDHADHLRARPVERDVNQAQHTNVSAKSPVNMIRPSISTENPSQVRLSYSTYLVQKLIGSGGSGKVYRALDRSSNRPVAIKFLKKSFLSQPEIVARFLKEAVMVAGLRHPRIVHVHGLGQTPRGGCFVVMDWLPAGDLNRQIESGPISMENAIRWVRDTADAIQFAHEQGIVHCDLKPANLLLDQSGEVVVSDFGLAKSISETNQEDFRVEGTASFMAIEQVVPGVCEIGPQTDVFGLGAVLYALLTGQPPYSGARPSDVLSQLIAGRAIPLPSVLRSQIPKVLDELCVQCLSRNPSSRPSTANEVSERLTALLQHHGTKDENK